MVYALTSAGEQLDPQEELESFGESAANATEIEIGDERGLMQVTREGAVAAGTAVRCGAVVLISLQETGVREVAPALRLPD